MELRVAHAGRLEWLVEPGGRVSSGALLARLQVGTAKADHCAVLPVLAPREGVLSWLRPAVLHETPARAVVALLDASAAEVAICECLMRRETRGALAEVLWEQRELARRLRSAVGLHRALLEPEHRALERRLVALRELEARLGVCEGP